jgi:peptidoglycan/xylan/chitin deacetylase (PgdA/CDA1 family)
MTWLDPLRAVLERAPAPATLFLRDDDAGWHDERLFALLDLVAERGLPIDLAVIPAELRPQLASRLLDRMESSAAPVGVHQHGLAHMNHERIGRKCEFGPARNPGAQRRDIATGRRLLVELLGPHVDPIFTPPWNRCTRDTGDCLASLGYLALSREARADRLEVRGLQELPVTVDWFAHRKGERISLDELGERLARAVEREGPVGIMFHHAEMGKAERSRASELLDLLAGHDNAVVWPMLALVEYSESMPARRSAGSRRGHRGAQRRRSDSLSG